MATALQEWREHRLDYRAPGAAALILLLGLAILLPHDWLSMSRLGTAGPNTVERQPLQLTGDEGLQILDVEILAPAGSLSKIHPTVPTRVDVGAEFESVPELEGGEGEFSWDPTHAYHLGNELLMPKSDDAAGGPDELLRSVEFILSSEGAASYTLSDTSHAALAQVSFTRLQREIFLKNAPGWAYDKAVERYRQAISTMLYENPLRGPQ